MIKKLTLLILIGLTSLGASSPESRRIVVLIDQSIDGTQEARILAMKEWLQILPAKNQQIAIAAYDEQFHELLNSKSLANELQRLEILNAIKTPAPNSSYSDLRLGLYNALKLFPEYSTEHKTLILLTNGNINLHGSDANEDLKRQAAKVLLRDIAPQFKNRDISIFPVTFSSKANFELLSELSQSTNGGLFRADRYQRRLWSRLFLDIYNQALQPIDFQSRKTNRHIPPGVNEVIFTLSKTAPRDGFALLSPDKIIYSSIKPKPISNAQWNISENSVVLTIKNPQPGDWAIESAISAAREINSYIDPTLELSLPKTEIPAGQALHVKGRITSLKKAINDPALFASLEWQVRIQKIKNGSKKFLGNLKLDENAKLDGEFNANFMNKFGSGKRTIYLSLQGRTIEREASGQVDFQPEWLFVKLDRESGYANQPTPVQAILDLDVQQLKQVKIETIIKSPDGQTKALPLGYISDGIYAEDINAFNQLGTYEISVKVNGTNASGLAFDRLSNPIRYLVRKNPNMAKLDKSTSGTQVIHTVTPGTTGNNSELLWLILIQCIIVALTAAFLWFLYRSMQTEESQIALHDIMQRLEQPRAEKVELSAGSQVRIRSQKRRGMATNDDFASEIDKMKEMFGDEDDHSLEDIPDFGFGDIFSDTKPDENLENEKPEQEPESDTPEDHKQEEEKQEAKEDIIDPSIGGIIKPIETQNLAEQDQSEVLDALFGEDNPEETSGEKPDQSNLNDLGEMFSGQENTATDKQSKTDEKDQEEGEKS